MNVWYICGVYSFSLGCVAFTYDAVKGTPLNKKYLAGCVLFDIGCVFFALDAHDIKYPKNDV